MADESEDTGTKKAIGKKELESLIRRTGSLANEVSTASGKIGEMIANAVEKNHLHRGAFGIVRKLHKMGKDNPAKLAEFLFNLDLYREHMALDEMLPDDMLPDRAGKRSKKGATEAPPKGARLRAVEGGSGEAANGVIPQ